MEVLIQM